ncbi:MAG: HEAT repeat domain-containing protein [Planctomycetes bacterium]|nr:HEAT repeat domain-containing protein [Planctomycetota bacterium]
MNRPAAAVPASKPLPAASRLDRILVATVASILAVALIGGWFALPACAPTFVVERSPFVSQALTVAAANEQFQPLFLKRVRTWDAAANPALVDGLGSRNVSKRLLSARALGLSGDGTAVAGLAAGLHDADAAVRRECARSLGQIPDQAAVVPLLHCLADQDEALRSAAITSLGRLRAVDAVDQLAYFLKDQDPSMRYAAAEALGAIGDERAVDALIPLIKDPGSAASAAINALGSIDGEKAVAALIGCLEGKDRDLALLARKSLEKCRLSPPQLNHVDSVVQRRMAEDHEIQDMRDPLPPSDDRRAPPQGPQRP